MIKSPNDIETDLLQAKKLTLEAREQYARAIEQAIENEWSNVRIARVLGVTETAVRSRRKRMGLR